MDINVKPEIRKNDVVIQQFEKELLIYSLKENKVFCLNQTSAMVWQHCNGAKTIAEIANLMSKDLKMPVSEDFVWLAISDLQKEKLVEVENNQPFFEGKSRREVIRKIGFASMIALPVISSLVAPRTVDAQSGGCLGINCNNGGTTFSQGSCCSGFRCSPTSVGSPICIACFPSNQSFSPGSGSPTTAAQCQNFCNSHPERQLCCNNTSPATINFAVGVGCFCRCP